MSFDYLIMAEKASAAKNFAAALGGMTGTFDGHSYQIFTGHGHLLTLKEPQELVPPEKADQYASWDLKYLPWDLNDFTWNNSKIVIKGYTDFITRFKQMTKEAKNVVIATDNDPSGEGELLAWEIIQAGKWNGPVLREYHQDEGKKSLIAGMRNLKDVSDYSKDGDYLKADVRNRWDFASMQLTRIATTAVKQQGYQVRVVPQGRLKSVMISLVKQRWDAINQYQKTPYFDISFKDENNHIFLAKTDDNKTDENYRFANQLKAQQKISQFKPSGIGDVVVEHRHSAPPKLMDLAMIDAALSKKGYQSTDIQKIYQTLYEHEYLSYPRTEDTTVTPEQFNDLLPNVDQIASLVGIDTKLLTHRQPRKTHVKAQGAHGANRPGNKVPQTLNELDQVVGKDNVGNCAQDMYILVAKSALSMFGEDYEYDSISANLTDYPNFRTKFQMPRELNYKLILSNQNTTEQSVLPLGKLARPEIKEGVNPKPSKPTKEWIYDKLSKYGKHGISTGATKQNTMADITNTKNPSQLLIDKKGVLALSTVGTIAAEMGEGTFISSPKITMQLFDGMDRVGAFDLSPDRLLATVTQVVNHDLPVMQDNALKLKAKLPKLTQKLQKPKSIKEKVSVEWQGKSIKFNKKWSNHTFTEAEIESLAQDETISFKNKGHLVTGKLAVQTYKGKEFVGFKMNKK